MSLTAAAPSMDKNLEGAVVLLPPMSMSIPGATAAKGRASAACISRGNATHLFPMPLTGREQCHMVTLDERQNWAAVAGHGAFCVDVPTNLTRFVGERLHLSRCTL